MVKAAPIQTAFNGGEWSPLMDGHINLEKRASSLKAMQNMIGLKQGAAVRRGGTKYVSEIKDSANRTHLVPFEYSNEQAYIIEFGDQYLRFYKDVAQILSGSAAYEISTPYLQADLFDSNGIFQINYAQSADVLYLVHGSYPPYVLSRTGHASWAINALVLDDGAYLETNITTTTLTLSGTSGSVTVTASASLFADTDVGRLIRWRDPANDWTWLKITAYTSTTVVTATIFGEDASAGTATVSWRLGVYSDATGYPRVITFYQNRLVLAGCSSYPDRYDMTKSGGYSSTTLYFAPTDADGLVTDDKAITGTLQSGQVNTIQWMAGHSQGLLIGTTSAEWIVRASATNEVITPTNSKADSTDDKGGAYIQPLSIEGGVLFSQKARRRLDFMNYFFDQDRVKGDDLTLFAEHITRSGVISMCYQQEPVNVVWVLRNDGVLIGMTFYPDQGVAGWHKHVIGGTDSIIESIATIPSSDGLRDELWMIVKRTINGSTKRYVEYMTRFYEDDMEQEDAICMDSALTYEGGATSSLSGLTHLEGETVKLLINGKAHPDCTVTAGMISLNYSGTVIHVGLGNEWIIETQNSESGAMDGTAQGKIKRINGFVVRLLNTLGLKYGTTSNNLDEYDFNQGASYDTMTPLFTGDTIFLISPSGYETNGRVYLSHDGVFPVCILAIMPQITTYDR